MQIRCEIKPKGHNPVFTEAHPVTIQEDLRRLTDAFELDNDTVSVRNIHREMLAIPCNPRRLIMNGDTISKVLVPCMGERNALPARVIE